MSRLFTGSSSPPSTPERNARGRGGSNLFGLSNNSTTPAGPPPSSTGSFTPVGAPSASYLGSSLMRGMSTDKAQSSFSASNRTSASSSSASSTRSPQASNRNMFARPQQRQQEPRRNVPLGRSIRKPPQPSRLRRQLLVEDDEDDEEEEQEDADEEDGAQRRQTKPGTFRLSYSDSDEDGDQEDSGDFGDQVPPQNQHAEEAADEEDDLWLDMVQEPSVGNAFGDDTDLMEFTTPAATERVRREAENIFRATAMNPGLRRREHKYAAAVKDIYNQLGCAGITEPPELILNTEAWVNRLYDDGVGEADDPTRLEETLAEVAGRVASLWRDHADGLPHSDEEHMAEIGPGPFASPFEKANYVASLALQVHHTRRYEDGRATIEPLPRTMFNWLAENHNLYPTQIDDILRHKPSPACHSLFWQTVVMALLRGKVRHAATLLEKAGWAHVRKGSGQYAYTGRALENVENAAAQTVAMLQGCPGSEEKWHIFSSDWAVFRVHAQGALDKLRRFAEGKDADSAGVEGLLDASLGSSLGSSMSPLPRGRLLQLQRQRQQQEQRQPSSLTSLARKAQSQVPWDIYENLNVVFEIVLGSHTAILEAAQDWCEAAVGLLGWWDERRVSGGGHQPPSGSRRSLALASMAGLSLASDSESYLDRLVRSFHASVDSEFEVNTLSPVEVGLACVFEDNANDLVGLLRAWSLPVASAVAEIASLGGWLAQHKPSAFFGLDLLDMDDLEVLGLGSGVPDEVDGIKDNTLVHYAQALAEYHELSTVGDMVKHGWELAISVVGRMDSPERSEEIVGELVRQLLETLDVDSGPTVDKIWDILNELGMIPFAEEASEMYADVLARDSQRHGECMWYYALAHRPNKVREVVNLLISYSLMHSAAYPPTGELDDYLARLIDDRNETLETWAKQDLEAAELIGKMVSGYACLRQFYHQRDHGENGTNQAAAALVSVIASADDNIRGGLYDASRDAIVSEEFLLALLGEALVFVSEPDVRDSTFCQKRQLAISLAQLDVLLKAVEDLHAAGTRVAQSCEEFLQLTLASAAGRARGGATPASLMRRSGTGSQSDSFVLSGSSVLAGQLQKSISGNSALAKLQKARRGWDWRTTVLPGTTGADIVSQVRTGVAKKLAVLWLAEADGSMW